MPKQGRFPNGRIFTGRYERVNRGISAPINGKIKRTYRRCIGPRRQRLRYFGPRRQRRRKQQPQQGKKAADTELGCMIVDDAVSLIPKAYKKLKNKLFGKKNKAVSNTNIYTPTRFTKETY